MPAVTVIIPARNAAATLSETLDSVLAQTVPSWNAVIVDDDSTDETSRIAVAYAARDPRVEVVQGSGLGEGAARNTGLQHARAEWLLFLDADDLIEPNALGVLLDSLRRDDSLDFVRAGSVRIAPDGSIVLPEEWDPHLETFEALSIYCPFTIHACIVRRSIVEAIGGFDTSLRAGADWDLWQRVVRAGAKLGLVPQTVARYRMRPDAVSNDARQIFEGGRRVIALGHSVDPRVPNPVPAYAHGRRAADEYAALLHYVCWVAGLAVGAGDDPTPYVLEIEANRSSVEARVNEQGGDRGAIDRAVRLRLDPEAIAYGIRRAALQPACLHYSEWPGLWPKIADGLRRFLAELERVACVSALAWRTELLLRPRPAGAAAPHKRDRFYIVEIDVAEPFVDVAVPAVCDRLLCVGLTGSEPLGLLELPVCDGRVPARVLADAVSARWFWPILLRFVESRGLVAAGRDSGAYWPAIMREVWGESSSRDAREISTDGSEVILLDLGRPLPGLVLKGAYADVLCCVGGQAIDVVRVEGVDRLTPETLRQAITRGLGNELLVAVVREGLLGRDSQSLPLRTLLANRPPASGDGDANRDDGSVTIGRRVTGSPGTSASRHAALPVACAADVHASATGAGEPVVWSGHPTTVLYDPARLWQQRKTPTRPSERRRWRRTFSLRSRPSRSTTEWLSILSYRCTSDDPSDGGVSPAALAEQLSLLRDRGFRTVSLDRWEEAMRSKEAVEGRVVVIAFERAGSEFKATTWPLLREFGFSPVVFVGPDADESLVRDLANDQIVIGPRFGDDHLLHELSPADLVRDASRARTMLTETLGHPPTCFSYPYEGADDAVVHLIGACGYVYGLTNVCNRAGIWGDALRLPTMPIAPSDSIDEFARKLSL